MIISEEILAKNAKISIIGLGYVGLPIAIEFAKQVSVIGFDIDAKKINDYKQGKDLTMEVGEKKMKESSIFFTSDEKSIQESFFHIVTVPTPINSDKTPDLSPVEKASQMIGRNLRKGSIVVYESTVYPGVTEDICIPILEKTSGLKCGVDFSVGYSPERINPGDKNNTLTKITKIVSGIDKSTLNEIYNVYNIIMNGNIHKASSIKVAEAAKVAENSQRDINIAFMNELSMVFNKMEIDSKDVIEAMNTKWNALNFTPGLVGGHCIGVDPYYFIYEAEKLGYHSQIILSGRKINDSMGRFIAENIVKQLNATGKVVKNAKVVIFGLTFKENTPDIRNSKVKDIIDTLNEYHVKPIGVDPFVTKEQAEKEFGIDILEINEVKDSDCLVFTVGHDLFKNINLSIIETMFNNGIPSNNVIIDVKSILDKNTFKKLGYNYWRL